MNTEILLKEIDKGIKERLSEERYLHSVRVKEKAEELARKYNVNVDKAKLTGLAHDIAKEIPKEEKIKYAEEHGIEVDEIEKVNIELLHAKIGADICKKQYNFTQDMQDAIKYHTVGNENMDDLAKVIFIADKTEDGRENMDLLKLKEAEEKGLNAILTYIIDQSIKHTIDKRKLLHPDSIYTRNKFLKSP